MPVANELGILNVNDLASTVAMPSWNTRAYSLQRHG